MESDSERILQSTWDDAKYVDRPRYGDEGKTSRSYVSNEHILLPIAVRDHAGRTTAETSRQLELNSAAQVASVTLVNKWRGWTVGTLKGIRGR